MSQNNPSPSPSPYPSPLLNEIHQYFPALLYDSDSFTTLPHVMNYVNSQMRRNFDIFSTNRERYLSRVYPPVHTPVNPPVQPNRRRQATSVSPSPPRRQRQRFDPEQNTHSEIHVDNTQYDTDDDGTLDAGLTPIVNWLANIMAHSQQQQPQQPQHPQQLQPIQYSQYTFPLNISSWLEPIAVSPSTEVLNTNTTVMNLESRLENPCVICQDTMEQGAAVRKITSCSHVFHRTCIDTWFQNHVHCPTCRHDVRQRQPHTTHSEPLNTNHT